MNSKLKWRQEIVPKKKEESRTIWDLCFSPDGSQIIVAATNRVLVYNGDDRSLIKSLRGHTGAVYAVCYSKDGKRFASGGADCHIIIWSSECEGLLKYSHNDPIQALSYNGTTNALLSCTANDFGLWSPQSKSVKKNKVDSKVLSCSWTPSGQYLALGLYSGKVEIRDNTGDLKCEFSVGSSPVWCLCFNPVGEDPNILAIGSWDQTLSFYTIDGMEAGPSKSLGFDPCALHFFESGEYLVVGGSNREAHLMTSEGVFLYTISTEKDSWIWATPQRPGYNCIVTGSNDGVMSMYDLTFETVCAIYRERYAYRDRMTDVIVQHLSTGKKVRIKHKDYIKKISIYHNRLAVQLPDRVVIYELTQSIDPANMKYRTRDKIRKSLECSHLVVTSMHVLMSQENKLYVLSFQGETEREYIFESSVVSIRVVGGPPEREGIIMGLRNGAVVQVYVNNPFPINLIRQDHAVTCLDLSSTRKQIAIVNDQSECLVYALDTKELVMKELNCTAAAWNTELEDMLCFSDKNDVLSIRTGDNFAMHKQKMRGKVVGFSGSRIFSLQDGRMNTIDVPQSASLYRYLDAGDYDMAYKVACLGVTETDWTLLGTRALYSMNFEIARESFTRVRNMRYIDLLNHVRDNNVDEDELRAEAFAYEGKFEQAAQTYIKMGRHESAINMYSDLWMWEEAKRCAKQGGNIDVIELNRRQALGMAELGDWKAAAEMYACAGDFAKAVKIYSEHKYVDGLQSVSRKLPKTEMKLLKQCAEVMHMRGANQMCKEIYLKINDIKSLLSLYVELHQWEDAFMLVKDYPGRGYEKDLYLPYAEYLVMNDRFEEAQRAYQDAGCPENSMKMLQQLTYNAVVEHRFVDASYYYHLLANENWKEFDKYRRLSRLYYAYSSIYEYVDEPFTTYMPESLFNVARYLLNETGGKTQPYGLSLVSVLYTLATHSKSLKAYVFTCWSARTSLSLSLSPSLSHHTHSYLFVSTYSSTHIQVQTRTIYAWKTSTIHIASLVARSDRS